MSSKNDKGFDKFIDDICKREEVARRRAKILAERDDADGSPQRKYNQLYRERWQNTIKWRR